MAACFSRDLGGLGVGKLLFAMDSITAAAMTGVDTGRLHAPLRLLRPWGSAPNTEPAGAPGSHGCTSAACNQWMMAQALVIIDCSFDVGWDYMQSSPRLPRHEHAGDGNRRRSVWFVNDVSDECASQHQASTAARVSAYLEACTHDKGGPLAAVPKQTPAQGYWGGRSADGPA